MFNLVWRVNPVQDYHRFHFPVSGTIRSIRHVRGKLYTVNPIAVASTYANVFTQVQLSIDAKMLSHMYIRKSLRSMSYRLSTSPGSGRTCCANSNA